MRMIQPIYDIFNLGKCQPVRNVWPVNHNYFNADISRGIQFCTRTRSATVFCNNQINRMLLQQFFIFGMAKRTFRNNNRTTGKWQGKFWLVDEPNKIMMIWFFSKNIQILLANCHAKFNPCLRASLGRVFAHLGSKRMRCINHMSNLVHFKIIHQSNSTAETTKSGWQRLWFWVISTTSVGKNHISVLLRKQVGQLCCLGCPAQQENAFHVK